ncbi:DUF3558 domain-containing protein [Saccharopolyspora rhizosphaerae]|uniref:DUF3558 domain-containing protein n=1 Tax=Saccharopolyspora rhizosphaerae TaxID=2492662 RepID=A0A3R8NTH4_9PSEU|nr:DUF3558 domain-containing protein [Saccharopolyspora rhizosphaerae]RRO12774.1 DUF3558 domain-containing protein [Saccharopolyspora rhizosphaerae]
MHSSCSPGVRRLGAVLGLGALALTGCGLWQSAPTADTAPPPPPPPAPTTSAPTSPPPRPFDIGLDGVDPCTLLTPDQRYQLGFDREPLPDSDAGFGNAATCSYRNTTAKVGARLALITTEGMRVWTDDTAQVEATPIVVHGFPALVIKTPGLDLSCNVAVDVSEGQHLDVLYRDDGGQPPPPVEQLCQGAQRVAEESVRTLAAPPASTSSTKPPTQLPSDSTP